MSYEFPITPGQVQDPNMSLRPPDPSESKWTFRGSSAMEREDKDKSVESRAAAEGRAYCEATSIHGPAYLVDGTW